MEARAAELALFPHGDYPHVRLYHQCVWEGHLSGRYDACLNRIRREQERLFREEDTAWPNPGVQAALEAISYVNQLLHIKAGLEARIAAQIAALDAKRRPVQDELSDNALQRVQEAVDQVDGTQETFDAMFADAKARCEEGDSLWQRLRRAFRGRPKSRQRQRDAKRRIV